MEAAAVSSSSSPSTFTEKVRHRQSGIITYGITPPKVATEASKLPTMAQTQADRIRGLGAACDGVILYDIHDEKDRTPNTARPFPFAATLDGLQWAATMGDVGKPYVHFRCIAKYEADEFRSQLATQFVTSASTGTSMGNHNEAVVIVGGAAASQKLPFNMDDAYGMRREVAGEVPLGAVAIPERHAAKGNEHERMVQKQRQGVSFFVTQCVYNLEDAKNLLSDYAALCRQEGLPVMPILITLTPCGSAKTLEFLRWLGVKVSKWLENDLLQADTDGHILEESVDALIHLFRELVHFAKRKGIPLGCNVESVAIRKVEIEASLRLVAEVRSILDKSNDVAVSASSPIA